MEHPRRHMCHSSPRLHRRSQLCRVRYVSIFLQPLPGFGPEVLSSYFSLFPRRRFLSCQNPKYCHKVPQRRHPGKTVYFSSRTLAINDTNSGSVTSPGKSGDVIASPSVTIASVFSVFGFVPQALQTDQCACQQIL